MSDEKKGWYVLRAISGKENKVKETLDAEIKNTDLGNFVFQVLIPTEKVYSVRNGKKVVKEKNLYSGYVFVEAILVERLFIAYVIRQTLSIFWEERLISRNP
ncbi:MAG: transcription termination/antitermination NusG family protein [Barnesiella sp.]